MSKGNEFFYIETWKQSCTIISLASGFKHTEWFVWRRACCWTSTNDLHLYTDPQGPSFCCQQLRKPAFGLRWHVESTFPAEVLIEHLNQTPSNVTLFHDVYTDIKKFWIKLSWSVCAYCLHWIWARFFSKDLHKSGTLVSSR